MIFHENGNLLGAYRHGKYNNQFVVGFGLGQDAAFQALYAAESLHPNGYRLNHKNAEDRNNFVMKEAAKKIVHDTLMIHQYHGYEFAMFVVGRGRSQIVYMTFSNKEGELIYLADTLRLSDIVQGYDAVLNDGLVYGDEGMDKELMFEDSTVSNAILYHTLKRLWEKAHKMGFRTVVKATDVHETFEIMFHQHMVI